MSISETAHHAISENIRFPFFNSHSREYGPKLTSQQREIIEIDAKIDKSVRKLSHQYRARLTNEYVIPRNLPISLDNDFEKKIWEIKLDIIRLGLNSTKSILGRDTLSIAAHGANVLNFFSRGWIPEVSSRMLLEGRHLLLGVGEKYKKETGIELDITWLRENGYKVMNQEFSSEDVLKFIYYPKFAEEE